MGNRQYLYQCMLDNWSEEEAFYCAASSCFDALGQFYEYVMSNKIRSGKSISCLLIKRVEFSY